MTIQIILLVLIILILWRVIDRFGRREIRLGELSVWLVFWLIVAGLVIWPDASQRVAELVGIGRGVDLVIYLALLLGFYLIFRVFVRLEKMERNITKIVRKIALDDVKEDTMKQETRNRQISSSNNQ